MSSSPQAPPFHWHYSDLDDTTSTTYQLRSRTFFYIVILFTIIVIAWLLFFYARRVCGRSTRSLTQPLYSAEVALPRGGELEATVINALPVLLYNGVDGGECCICLSLFEEGEKVKLLPECKHCFHSECVDRWLVTHSSCPLCRTSLRFDEQVGV